MSCPILWKWLDGSVGDGAGWWIEYEGSGAEFLNFFLAWWCLWNESEGEDEGPCIQFFADFPKGDAVGATEILEGFMAWCGWRSTN